MDLATLEQTVYELLGFDPPVPQAVINRVRRYINATQRELMGKKGIGSMLRRKTLPLSTVASTPTCVLPQSAVGVYGVVDRTNNTPLTYLSMPDQRYSDPGQLSLGNPYAYDIFDYASHVAKDPSAAGQLTAVSDSASDGATKKVFVEVTRTGGYFQAGNIALNGLTPVNVGPTDSVYVLKFYISLTGGGPTTATGNILLKDGAGNEIARITPTRSYARYTRLQLYPIPSSVLTLYADVDVHIEDLTQASDTLYIHEDFCDVLECGALKKEYKKREKINLYKLEDERWRKRVAELRSYLNKSTGAVLNPDHPRRFSQLGPNYPPGT